MTLPKWLRWALPPFIEQQRVADEAEKIEAEKGLEEAKRLLNVAQAKEPDVDAIAADVKRAMKRNHVGQKLEAVVRVARRT